MYVNRLNKKLLPRPPYFATDILFIGMLKLSLCLEQLEKYDKEAKAMRREDRMNQ